MTAQKDIEDLYDGAPAPRFLCDLAEGGSQAFSDFFFGELPLREYAGNEPEVLLVELLLTLGDQIGFRSFVDDSLEQLLDQYTTESKSSSHPLFGTALTRLFRVVASDESLVKSARKIAKILFSPESEGWELFASGRAEDPVLEARRVMVRHERVLASGYEAELRRLWWRSLGMPTSEPWYRSRLGIMGLGRLDPTSRFPETAVRAFGPWWQALERFVNEGWITGGVAYREYEAAARDLVAAFRPYEGDIADNWATMDEIPAKLKTAIPARRGRHRPQHFYALTPPSVSDVHDMANLLQARVPSAIEQAGALVQDLAQYADATGDTIRLVRAATQFSKAVRNWDAHWAVVWSKMAIEYEPLNPYGWNTLAEAYSRQRRFREALETYAHSVALFPENPVSRGGLASTFSHVGRYREAELVYREAIDHFPNRVALMAGLGHTLNLLDRHQEAKEVYQEALENSPNNIAAMAGLGQSYILLEDYGAAEAQYALALRVWPGEIGLLNGLKWSEGLKDHKQTREKYLSYLHQREWQAVIQPSDGAESGVERTGLSDADLEVLAANAPLIRRFMASAGISSYEEAHQIAWKALQDLQMAVDGERTIVEVLSAESASRKSFVDDAEKLLRDAVDRYPGSMRYFFAHKWVQLELARLSEPIPGFYDGTGHMERLYPVLKPIAVTLNALSAALSEDRAKQDEAFGRLSRWTRRAEEASAWNSDRDDAVTPLRSLLRQNVFLEEKIDNASVAHRLIGNWDKIGAANRELLYAKTTRGYDSERFLSRHDALEKLRSEQETKPDHRQSGNH